MRNGGADLCKHAHDIVLRADGTLLHSIVQVATHAELGCQDELGHVGCAALEETIQLLVLIALPLLKGTFAGLSVSQQLHAVRMSLTGLHGVHLAPRFMHAIVGCNASEVKQQTHVRKQRSQNRIKHADALFQRGFTTSGIFAQIHCAETTLSCKSHCVNNRENGSKHYAIPSAFSACHRTPSTSN
jgi:hypothetical protein